MSLFNTTFFISFLILCCVTHAHSHRSHNHNSNSNSNTNQNNRYLYPYPKEYNIPNPSIDYGPQSDDGLLIQTHSGLIQGQMIAPNVRAFRSIPYASPPIDDLRWQNPQIVEPWGNNTVDATYDPPGCPQTCDLPPHTCPAVQSEDCLFLNIFTPSVTSQTAHKRSSKQSNAIDDDSDSGLYNVFLFIHGGNFKQGYGGGLMYNGTEWVNLTNTIVVTINYRLGSLGFLFSVEAGMDGNFGFLDQQLAMKWIYDNIGYFGGNKQNITIFGQSAGAVSVALHMSQTSEDDSLLYSSAIMESEPFALPVRDTITWGALPLAFFNDLNCNLTIAEHDSIVFWECLRNKTIKEIIKAQNKAENDVIVETGHLLDLFMPWSPTVGTDLFYGQPLFMFQQTANANNNNQKNTKNNKNTDKQQQQHFANHSQYTKNTKKHTKNSANNANSVHSVHSGETSGMIRNIPYIIGTVMNEGTEFIYMAYPNGVDREELDETLITLVGFDVAVGIREHYPLPRNTSDYRDYLSLVATDGLFKCPTRNASVSLLNEYSSFDSKIFMYHFDHVSSFNVNAWCSNYSECYDVVCHGSELPYVFRPNLGPIDSVYSNDEWLLAKSIQLYWTEFGTNDGLTPGSGFLNVNWDPFTLGSEMSLLLQAGDVEMQSRVDWDDSKCQFWDSTGYTWIK